MEHNTDFGIKEPVVPLKRGLSCETALDTPGLSSTCSIINCPLWTFLLPISFQREIWRPASAVPTLLLPALGSVSVDFEYSSTLLDQAAPYCQVVTSFSLLFPFTDWPSAMAFCKSRAAQFHHPLLFCQPLLAEAEHPIAQGQLSLLATPSLCSGQTKVESAHHKESSVDGPGTTAPWVGCCPWPAHTPGT